MEKCIYKTQTNRTTTLTVVGYRMGILTPAMSDYTDSSHLAHRLNYIRPIAVWVPVGAVKGQVIHTDHVKSRRVSAGAHGAGKCFPKDFWLDIIGQTIKTEYQQLSVWRTVYLPLAVQVPLPNRIEPIRVSANQLEIAWAILQPPLLIVWLKVVSFRVVRPVAVMSQCLKEKLSVFSRFSSEVYQKEVALWIALNSFDSRI